MKRLLYIGLAIILMFLLFVPLLLLMALVKFKLGSDIILTQLRPSLNGKPFRMFKLKTMTSEKDFKGDLLPDSMRMNDLGKRLRASSLDELPELWNVIKGDMSLVGPRPLLTEYLPLYNSEQAKRHNIRPGIT